MALGEAIKQFERADGTVWAPSSAWFVTAFDLLPYLKEGDSWLLPGVTTSRFHLVPVSVYIAQEMQLGYRFKISEWRFYGFEPTQSPRSHVYSAGLKFRQPGGMFAVYHESPDGDTLTSLHSKYRVLRAYDNPA